MCETNSNVRMKNFMIYTASGFRTDIETLFAKFDELKSFKFKDFSECFNEMKFSLIFRGRHNDNEMHEFIDECYLEVLYQLVNKDKSVSHRICSLFLLYALYVKQPLDQSLKTRFDIKIRITLDQLMTIRQFIDYCKQNSYLEVCYVWYKLMSIGVDFVYYRYSSLGPSNTRSVNYYMFQNVNSSTDKLMSDMKKSVESHMKSIETNHEIYNDFKDKVFDGKQISLDSKPNIISQELYKDSANKLNKLVTDFKYSNRQFRGRGRPSIWTPYRNDDKNELETNDYVNNRQKYLRKRASKNKNKIEIESIPHILWSEDIIDSMKRIKAKKALNKKHKSDISLMSDQNDIITKPKQTRKRKSKYTNE